MKILDRLVSILAILFLALVSIVFILIPFNVIEIFSLKSIVGYVKMINGNYLYSVLGIIVLLLSMKVLFSGIGTNKNRSSQIITHMNFGDLKISDQAIEGLTHNVISKIIGIRDSKIIVDFIEGYVRIFIRGQVSPDINIPEVASIIQNKVKETIENHTGIGVKEVNVEVVAIAAPVKTLK